MLWAGSTTRRMRNRNDYVGTLRSTNLRTTSWRQV
jgi:hypothetical protein